MTIPVEEKSALIRTKKFLRGLVEKYRKARSKEKVEIRDEASGCLRHFPMDYRIEKIWAKEIEDWEREVLGKQ